MDSFQYCVTENTIEKGIYFYFSYIEITKILSRLHDSQKMSA